MQLFTPEVDLERFVNRELSTPTGIVIEAIEKTGYSKQLNPASVGHKEVVQL